ncbi:DegV family protein [Desulfofalx alkaliphila]|uniref:DegV family protein n=1 Tax=Desulfofalx alkaliphila TaxID=105483 RepID=UPI00054E57E9|nr:DegV family protein [Desulfofalx alkaliphila]
MSNTGRKIAVVTDSTCDLSDEQIKDNDIKLLSLKVVYKDRQYIDRLEIKPEDVFAGFAKEIPKTSMPSPGEVENLYRKLADQGYTDIISIHISSGLSGTYQMVKAVGQQLKDLINVEAVDSKTISIGSGLIVLEASRLVQAGMGLKEVMQKISKLKEEIKLFFVPETLEYLIKGGRIGYVKGRIGEILNVKPIVSVNDEGKYYTYQNVRGRRRSLAAMVEIAKEYAAERRVKLALLHGNALQEAKEMVDKLNLPNIDIVRFDQIGPVIAVHTGPGVIGLAFYDEDYDKNHANS